MNRDQYPLLSVIVPVYNVEEYLSRCIDSILSQTFTNFELILVDDGSQDRSGDICDQYAKKDGRIVVIHQPNRGVSAARNVAINIARGQFLTFVDSDDKIGTIITFSENLQILIDREDVDIVQYPIQIKNEKGDCILIKDPPRKLLSGMQELYLSCFRDGILEGYLWGKIYRTSVFTNTSIRIPENLVIGEDAYCLLDIIEIVHKVYISDMGYYEYLYRETSAIHTDYTPIKSLSLFRMKYKSYLTLCRFDGLEQLKISSFITVIKGYIEVKYRYKNVSFLEDEFKNLKELIPNKICVEGISMKDYMRMILIKLFGLRFFCQICYLLVKIKTYDK